MPDLIDHVGYLDRSLAAIRLPIKVKRIPNDWKISSNDETCWRRYDEDAKACYTDIRSRLLSKVSA